MAEMKSLAALYRVQKMLRDTKPAICMLDVFFPNPSDPMAGMRCSKSPP